MRLGLYGSNLDEAGVEQHIEHEGDDPCWEYDFLSFYQNSCWTVWDFINCDEKDPIDAQKDHDNDKLRAKGIWEAIIFDNS